MLLDSETFDLVQHIDTFLATVVGHELEAQMKAELMQSVLEIATPVCRNGGRRRPRAAQAPRVRRVGRAGAIRCGSALSGTHPFSLFERQRITARDRYRALVDQLQYIARRELIFGLHVHVAVDDPEKAIQVVNGLPRRAAASARALRELAVLARRADRALFDQAARLRRVSALRPAAPLQGLRRLRGGRRPAREDRLHRRLHAHLVGHPPPPAARARSRSASATRSRASSTPSPSPRTARRS